MKYLILCITLLLIAANVQGQKVYPQHAFALEHVHVVDVVHEQVIRDQTLLVRSGKIVGWQPMEMAIDTAFERIPCHGYFAFPGMIDVHTHLESLKSADIAIKGGVTTIRTAGVSAYQDVALAQLVEDGHVPGPDVIPAGVYVTPELGETVLADPRLGPLMDGVLSAEDLREIVRINIDRGAKVIKTRGTERAGRPETDPREQTYTMGQLEAVIDEAAQSGVPVMIHAHGDEGARAAVMAGARSIEHGTFLSEETLQLMADRGTYLVPTYITLRDLVEPGGDYDHPVVHMRGQYMIPKSERVIRNAMALGVPIATGADNSYQEVSTSRVSMEAMHFVRLGMDSWEALRTISRNGAELLGVDDQTGHLAPGLEADLVLLPDNPVEDILALQDVLMVMSNGHIITKRFPFGKE